MRPDKLAGEIFLPIPNTAERYFYSQLGRVWSTRSQKFIRINPGGYVTCQTLTLRGHIKLVNHSIARLVLRNFQYDTEPSKYIKYKDKRRNNCHIENVSWSDERQID